jgi:hypothetical protein
MPDDFQGWSCLVFSMGEKLLCKSAPLRPDSLTGRLDRLMPVKEVAQIGAAIGREFSYELLAMVSPLRQNQLNEALARLEQSELVFRRGAPPRELRERVPVTAGETPYVRFDLNDYSIPHTHVRRQLTVLADLNEVCIVDDQHVLACHRRSYDKGAQI